MRFEPTSRRPAPRLFGAVLTALTLLAPDLAWAQSDKDVETARADFIEASRLADQSHWAEARERYLLSLRLKRAAITLYSLGVVNRELGRLVEAREGFRAFLDEPSAPATKRFEQPARQALAEIDARLAAEQPAESNKASPSAPVVASASVPVAAPDRTLPLTLIGAGSALFVVGAVTGLIGLGEAGNATSKTGPDAESARTKGVVGDIVGGIGLATAGAGILVLLLQKRPEPASAVLSVRPWFAGTSAGVWMKF